MDTNQRRANAIRAAFLFAAVRILRAEFALCGRLGLETQLMRASVKEGKPYAFYKLYGSMAILCTALALTTDASVGCLCNDSKNCERHLQPSRLKCRCVILPPSLFARK